LQKTIEEKTAFRKPCRKPKSSQRQASLQHKLPTKSTIRWRVLKIRFCL
jgi:hypothetical protein